MQRSLCGFFLCTIAGIIAWPLLAQEATDTNKDVTGSVTSDSTALLFDGMGSRIRGSGCDHASFASAAAARPVTAHR